MEVFFRVVFFNLYLHVLIETLRKSGYGCEISQWYCGIINHAGDILLLKGWIIKL